MQCSKCDGDVEVRTTGEAVCQDCGAQWANALALFGDKYADVMRRLGEMEIRTNADCLPLMAELVKLESYYSEIVDELTVGCVL